MTTAASGVLSLADFNAIFFSVNKSYREAPKAAWLVADATMKIIRNAVDDNGRPLINLEVGTPIILGKPVYTCPSLPSGAGSTGIVFGDLSHYYVHCSNLLMRRLLQVPGLIEYGKCRYHALQLVDAVVNDPTSGSLAPIVYATLHS